MLSKFKTSSSIEITFGPANIKQYKVMRKLTTGKSEDYTTGFLLDYAHLSKIIID